MGGGDVFFAVAVPALLVLGLGLGLGRGGASFGNFLGAIATPRLLCRGTRLLQRGLQLLTPCGFG